MLLVIIAYALHSPLANISAMADKRPGNGFNYIQPRSKIPKLDISIVASGSSSSQRSANDRFVRPAERPAAKNSYLTSVSGNHATTSAAGHQPAAMSEDMWGDDDVELIMLASQVNTYAKYTWNMN